MKLLTATLLFASTVAVQTKVNGKQHARSLGRLPRRKLAMRPDTR